MTTTQHFNITDGQMDGQTSMYQYLLLNKCVHVSDAVMNQLIQLLILSVQHAL